MHIEIELKELVETEKHTCWLQIVSGRTYNGTWMVGEA